MKCCIRSIHWVSIHSWPLGVLFKKPCSNTYMHLPCNYWTCGLSTNRIGQTDVSISTANSCPNCKKILTNEGPSVRGGGGGFQPRKSRKCLEPEEPAKLEQGGSHEWNHRVAVYFASHGPRINLQLNLNGDWYSLAKHHAPAISALVPARRQKSRRGRGPKPSTATQSINNSTARFLYLPSAAAPGEMIFSEKKNKQRRPKKWRCLHFKGSWDLKKANKRNKYISRRFDRQSTFPSRFVHVSLEPKRNMTM